MDRRIRLGFGIAVAVQVIILFVVPAKTIYTLTTGTEIVLKTDTRSPYDPLSGYAVNLSYRIATPDELEEWSQFNDGDEVFVTLDKQEDGTWDAVRLSATTPAGQDPESLFIRGRVDGGKLLFGIETYYVPESEIGHISERFRSERESVRVVVSVDRSGHSALKHLLIGGVKYDF